LPVSPPAPVGQDSNPVGSMTGLEFCPTAWSRLLEAHPMNDPSHRFVLRDLPLDARLVLAAFLFSVGIGYFSALVQLHFQAASPGQILPGPKESGAIYHGPKKVV